MRESWDFYHVLIRVADAVVPTKAKVWEFRQHRPCEDCATPGYWERLFFLLKD